MNQRRVPAFFSILICISLLSSLLIFTVAHRAHAAPYPSLKTAPLETLQQAVDMCPPEKKALFEIVVHPPAFSIWPGQKIQVSWRINFQNGERWIFPVFLRKTDKEGGEEVPPIWMLSIDSAELPKGLTTYHLVTYCGVDRIDLALAPKPLIENMPHSVMGGESIRIFGKHFNDWDPDLLREARIIEQGGERTLKIEKWNDNEIVATLPEDAYTGRQRFYIKSGRTKRRFRRSVDIPLAVVYRERFPLLSLTALLEKVFYGMDIHLNNFGPQRSGPRLLEKDAYIRFGAERGAERVYLNIPEYDIDTGETGVADKGTPRAKYYINDINMDNVKVFSKEDGWSMTLYFEKMQDELIGIDPENLDIRAYVSVEERPPALQLDNLKVVVDFDLKAEDGVMVVSPKKIETFGDISGSGTNCLYKSIEVCEQLKEAYGVELIDQLSEKIGAFFALESTRALFAEAVDPWLADYGMGEVIEINRSNDEVVIDYLPR